MNEQAVKQQLSFPFEVFEEEVLNPLSGQTMTAIETYIAQLLLETSSDKPTKISEIIGDLRNGLNEQISERQVKAIIRSFRRDRAFPILSRKGAPAGYWWCRSLKEMKEFSQLWQSQYFDEMRTLYMMMKHNYPQLAGQLRLPNISPVEKRR